MHTYDICQNYKAIILGDDTMLTQCNNLITWCVVQNYTVFFTWSTATFILFPRVGIATCVSIAVYTSLK